MFRKRNLIRLIKTKKLNRRKFKKKFRLNFFQRKKIIRRRKLKRPIGVSRELAAAFLGKREYRKEFRKRRIAKKIKTVFSRRVNLDLFKITYDMLLNYHSPLGKKLGEWKPSVMLTNVLLVRNTISILDLTTVFFSLRKMISRLFKALKLRKGIAILNGRKYRWQKVFTFVFERWLPGFFTNFYLNIKELLSYFFKRKALSRRQRTRILSLKMLSYEPKFLYRRRKLRRLKYRLVKKLTKLTLINRLMSRKKKVSHNKIVEKLVTSYKLLDRKLRKKIARQNIKRKKNLNNLTSFLKLPSVSLSLIDNIYWLRECQKEGITTIQVTDVTTEIEKIDYPIISNQKSLAFLSFLTLLAKEIAYQARYWELTNFKKLRSYYLLNNRLKKNNLKYAATQDKKRLKKKYFNYKRRLLLGYPIRKRFEQKINEKLTLRTLIVNNSK